MAANVHRLLWCVVGLGFVAACVVPPKADVSRPVFVERACAVPNVAPDMLARLRCGSVATAEDFDWVRQALGVARWNVYGESYGTTVAMTLAARHRQSVRSLVLDSVFQPLRDGDRVAVHRGADGGAGYVLPAAAAGDRVSAAVGWGVRGGRKGLLFLKKKEAKKLSWFKKGSNQAKSVDCFARARNDGWRRAGFL